MTKAQIIAELKSRGYTAAVTMAGPIPLDDWDPYGSETVNYQPGESKWQGEFIDGDRVRDIPRYPVMPGFCLGVWEFDK